MVLFNKSYFWSYDTKNIPSNLIIEQVLKYGDIEEIRKIISDYGLDVCKSIWKKKIISDIRFKRLNYFLARFVFKVAEKRIDVLRYLDKNKSSRFEKSL
jgi:hypothetical protein